MRALLLWREGRGLMHPMLALKLREEESRIERYQCGLVLCHLLRLTTLCRAMRSRRVRAYLPCKMPAETFLSQMDHSKNIVQFLFVSALQEMDLDKIAKRAI